MKIAVLFPTISPHPTLHNISPSQDQSPGPSFNQFNTYSPLHLRDKTLFKEKIAQRRVQILKTRYIIDSGRPDQLLAEKQFCPSGMQDSVLVMVDKCFWPHGLLPGPGFGKTKEEIHECAVRTAYDFCVVDLLTFSLKYVG